MACRTPFAAAPAEIFPPEGEPGGLLPPGVVADTFMQWNGVLWVPSTWTLPTDALAGDIGEVLTVTGANASDWAAPPVLPATSAYHYAFGAQQVNTGTGAMFPFFSTSAATTAFAAATGAIAQFTGTLKNLWVTHGTPTGADNIVYVVFVNDVITPLTVTLSSGAAGPASNLVDTIGVNAGDKITLRTTGPVANLACVPRAQLLLVPGAFPTTPATIMGESTVAWWRSDLGVTLSGGNVSAWQDKSGNNIVLSQATGGLQPAFNGTGGPSSTPSILFDGTDDRLVNTALNRPAPATTRTFVWIVARQVTWTSTDRAFGFGTVNTHMALIQNVATPQVAQSNVTIVNSHSGWPVNTYKRGEVYFSGSTSDYVKFGSAAATTGASAGNTDPAATFVLGASGAQTLFGNVEVCELAIFSALPTGAQLADLDAYVTARYGAGLV